MSFDVDIGMLVRGERRSFQLRVRFRTHARRTVIYGPSGAGKSLTLQALAGLITPDSGRIAFADEVLFDGAVGIDIPARRRGFGYLFQDYALFPKLNVRQNIAFGLQGGLRNPSAHVGGEVVERWLRAFELLEVAAQRPGEISGGQRQRTALARALVHSPRALLLDEPFSALDPLTRATLHELLLGLWRELRPTVVMVTHDVEEAVVLADRVIVMKPRPGRLSETITIRLPRPRDRLSPLFDAAKRRVMQSIDRSLSEQALPARRQATEGSAFWW